MTCAPHAAQINLRFGNAAREFLDFRASVRSGHFARECLNFLRQIGVDKNGQAQPVAVRISRRALDGRLFWLNEGKLVPVTKNLFARAHHQACRDQAVGQPRERGRASLGE